jgi:uncharacterized phage protein (TIGR01671 family)
MREILFRGKTASGEWVEGFFMTNSGGETFIQPKDAYMPKDVDRETVGQFTGLLDKNGKKIFEGDVINTETGFVGNIFEVVFDEVQASFKTKLLEDAQSADYRKLKGELRVFNYFHRIERLDVIEVIGNIHDSPELMENKNEPTTTD